jgi:Protein of unknown function (DUF433)
MGVGELSSLGGGEADLLADYPSLTQGDLQAAWDYATNHREEIDLAIQENEEGEEGAFGVTLDATWNLTGSSLPECNAAL